MSATPARAAAIKGTTAMRPKAHSERAHAMRRCSERYGYALREHEYHGIIRQIRDGTAEFSERQSHRVSVFFVRLPDGQRARVVYDRTRGELVSFLPLELRP